MESVKKWLVKRDYDEGVALYLKHGASDFLKKLFQSQRNDFTEKKLCEELRKLAPVSNPKRSESDIEPAVTTVKPAPEEPNPKQNQFVITKLQHELKQIYRSIDNNRYQLLRATSNRTRKEYAFQILFLHRKKMAIYEQLDYYHENGVLPTAPKERPCKTNEIQRLYVQIWKAKKRLEKTPEKIRNRAKTENLLAEKEAQLERLKLERSMR